MSDADELVEAIRGVGSLTNSSDLDRLDEALLALSHVRRPELAMDALFGLFERFPAEDAAGLLASIQHVLSGARSQVPPSVRHVAAFWSALHQLETFNGYEVELVNSLRRAPSEFGLIMLIRLIGGGRQAVGDVDLRDMLRGLSTARDAPPRVRDLARRSIGRRDLL